MTIRTYFNTRKKRILIGFLSCAVTAIVSAFFSVQYEILLLFTLLCVMTAFAVMYLAVTFGFRCPMCKGQWGYLAMYSGRLFSIREDLRTCPYCGSDLDKEF